MSIVCSAADVDPNEYTEYVADANDVMYNTIRTISEEFGWSSVPLTPGTKTGYQIDWKPYQMRRPTSHELAEWFDDGRAHNYAIICGEVSNLVVVDGDSASALDWMRGHLPYTPIKVKTNRGEHWYYAYPMGTHRVPKQTYQFAAGEKAIDIQAGMAVNGGVSTGTVLGPRSIHPSGVTYTAVIGDGEMPVFDPRWFPGMTVFAPDYVPPVVPPVDVDSEPLGDVAVERARAYMAKVPPAIEGQGGDALTFRTACALVRGFNLLDGDALNLLAQWNSTCQPQWSTKELRAKIANARTSGSQPYGYLLNETRTNTEPEAKATPAWRMNPRTGQIDRDHRDNYRIALSQLNVSITHNEFIRKDMLNAKPISDRDVTILWGRIVDTFGFKPTQEQFNAWLVSAAAESAFHPVRDYLDGLMWDGTPRIDTWLSTYCGAAETPYTRAVGLLPLLAAVRRIRKPGTKFDTLVVFKSKQGTGKSTAVRALCPDDEWFSDSLQIGHDPKVVIELTAGKWLVEISELAGHGQRDNEHIKAMLSRQADSARGAYARHSVDIPRQFVMIGTVNLLKFRDPSGARRFLPIEVGVNRPIDVSALVRDRDQLWAEAVAREAAGESLVLPRELWTVATENQEQFQAYDPWTDQIEELLTKYPSGAPIPVPKVWEALGGEGGGQSSGLKSTANQDRLERLMLPLGYVKGKPYVNGKQMRCWVSTAEPSVKPSSFADISL